MGGKVVIDGVRGTKCLVSFFARNKTAQETVPNDPARFTCGVLEETLMERQVAPQEEAEAEGVPRLKHGIK